LVQLDVSAEASVIHAVEEKAWISFGFIDILLSNAGFRGAPFVAKPLSFLVFFPDLSLFLPLMFLIREGKKKKTG
jgi:NAD(P)-dependent dehydrogenase (short-subunit alcohol dehydrogenase family)